MDEPTTHRTRAELYHELMSIYPSSPFSEREFIEMLTTRYNTQEVRLMTVEQLGDLLTYLRTKMQGAG